MKNTFNACLQFVIAFVLLHNHAPLYAQPDCASYSSQPLAKIERSHYFYPTMATMNEVDYSLGNQFFILEKNTDLYNINWSGHYITIAKYDKNLTRTDTAEIYVEMGDNPNPRSNLRVFVLGESLYISYLENSPDINKRKSITLYVQKVDLTTFTIDDNKLALFTGDINQVTDYYPYIDIRQNLHLDIANNKEYLSIVFFGRDEMAPAVLQYQILDTEFDVKYEGEMPVNERIDKILTIETRVNNNGALAVGIKLNKVGRVGENNENTFRVFLVNEQNNSSTFDMEDKLGYATDMELYFTESVLVVDCDWQYYTDEKPSGMKYKTKIFDVATTKAFPDFVENILEYLPEPEKNNFKYGKSAKPLDELSESFKLMNVKSDQGKQTYFLFRYQIPDKFHTANLKTDDLFAYYLVKVNGQMEKQWAHLIYYPTDIFETMVFKDNKVTLLAQGFSSPGARNTTNSYDVFDATNEASTPGKYKSYELQFNENGDVVVKDFMKACGDYDNVFNFESSYFIQKYQTFILMKTGADKRITRISY